MAQDLGDAVLTLKADGKQLFASIAAADKTLAGFTKKQMVGLGLLGGAVGAAGLGAIAMISSSLNVYKDFEQQLSSLGAVADATDEEMAQLKDQAIELGASTAFSATEVAVAQTELAKGGLGVADILGGALPAALALAAAGELELGEAAETTVNAMKLFGIEADGAAQVADMLATAANVTTADVQDFADAFKQGGAVAKQAGWDMNDALVTLEALAEAGVKGSDAGTAMKSALVKLLSPTAKQQRTMDELGLSFTNANGELKNGIQISKDLRKATDGMTQAERARIFTILGGTDGFRTLAALYDAGPKKLKRMAEANLEAGTAEEVAATKMDNTAGAIEELSGAWETLQILVGGAVNPVFRKVVEILTDVVNAINDVIVGGKEVGGSFGTVRVVPEWLRKVKKVLEDLKPVFDVIGYAAGAMFSFLKNVVAGFIQIWQGVFQILTGVFNIFAGLFTADWSRLWSGVKQVFGGVWTAIKGSFRIATAAIRTIASKAWQSIGGKARQVWSTVKAAFSSGVSAAVGFLKTLPGRAGAALASLASKLAGVARRAWTGFKQAVQNGASNVVGFIKSIPGRIVNGLGNLGDLLYNSGKALIEGFIRGIKAAGEKAVQAAKDVANKVRNIFPFSEPKDPSSPLRGLAKSGRAIITNLTAGMDGRIAAQATRQALGPISDNLVVAGAGDAAKPNLLVRVQIGDRDITDIVRSEIDEVDKLDSAGLFAGLRPQGN